MKEKGRYHLRYTQVGYDEAYQRNKTRSKSNRICRCRCLGFRGDDRHEHLCVSFGSGNSEDGGRGIRESLKMSVIYDRERFETVPYGA